MRFADELLIAAPIEIMWELTTDVENLPDITPTMRSVTKLEPGPVDVGSRVRVHQPAQLPAVWTVTRLDPPSRFSWERSIMGATMTGSHHLEYIDGRTRNTLAIDINGRGATLIGRLVGRSVTRALRAENLGFRKKAESLAEERRETD